MENNTKAVLEAAGADRESVERYLARNELAGKVAEAIRADYEPEISEEEAQVGRLTYALFSNTGLYDVEGNFTPFTEEELAKIQQEADDFAALAADLGDISAAGEQFPHTVIDVYFNEDTDGGAQPGCGGESPGAAGGRRVRCDCHRRGLVCGAACFRSGCGRHVGSAGELKESAKQEYLQNLEDSWAKETPLKVDENVWETVQIDGLITEIGGDGSHE